MKTGSENTTSGSENSNQSMSPEALKLIQELSEKIKKLEQDRAQPVAFSSQGMSADDIAKIVAAAVNTRDRDLDFQAGIKEEDIPEDDYLETPVRFCAPSTGYVIVDDTRKGHRVLLPYNKKAIYFEYSATRRVQQGKYESISPFSIYQCCSKKELEWLRNHSLYNTMFYETSTAAVGTDIVKMQKLARIMTILTKYELPDLIRRAKDYDLPITEDISVLRSNLAYKMVESEIQSEMNAAQRLLSDTSKEAMLLQQK